MNKTLRKFIPIVMAVGSLCACSSSNPKPGKLENLVGTYELDVYEMRRDESDSKTNYDRKAELNAKAYFTIDKNGYGYYGYSDKTTPARVNQIFSRFNYDEDKPNLIRTINMTDGVSKVYYDKKAVGCLNEPQMGFRDEMFQKTLSYTLHSGHMLFDKDAIIHYQYVKYKRIDTTGNLAKINQLMGTNVSFKKPYEFKAFSGYHVYRCDPKDGTSITDRGAYEYAILDCDSYLDGKVKLYYSLKDDPGLRTKQLTISVVEKGTSIKMEGLGKTFYSVGSGSGLPSSFSSKPEDYNDSDLMRSEWFNNTTSEYGQGKTLEEIIELERTPRYGPYVMHKTQDGQKDFESMSFNNEGDTILDGLHLEANEEFAINTRVYSGTTEWKYYEDLADGEHPVVQGALVPEEYTEVDHHYFKVASEGDYNIRLDRISQKVSVSLAS